MISVRCDMCAFNLVDKNGDYVMKPTRLVTTAVAIAEAVTQRCPGDHHHAGVMGRGDGTSARAGEYT
eukprot:1701883-Prorocentrum_lima.AAC.1